jgi:hypothetical protein
MAKEKKDKHYNDQREKALDHPNEQIVTRKHQLKLEKKVKAVSSSNEGIEKGVYFLPEI